MRSELRRIRERIDATTAKLERLEVERDEWLRAAAARGIPDDEIAEMAGVSLMRVYEVLAGERKD